MPFYAYDTDNIKNGVITFKNMKQIPGGWEFTTSLEEAKRVVLKKLRDEIAHYNDVIHDLCDIIESVEDMEEEQ